MFIENPNSSHISNYKLQNKIGKGSFATVFKAIHIGTNRVCAIKRIDKSCLLSETANAGDKPQYDMQEVEIIKREIRISKKADHPLIVHFYETFEDEDFLYFVMEYIEGESMLNYVNSNGKLSEDQARYFFKQLISCVEYLHNQLHVTHRDLKAENIIVDVHNNIRLIDFGLSSESSSNDEKSNTMMSTICGSPAYAAPELVRGNEYSNSVDIWSCGIVLYSMVFASLPFYDENVTKLFHKVVFDDPEIPNTVSSDLSNLILQMLQKDPKERISIEKIKETDWFTSSGKNSTLNIDFSFLYDSTLKVNSSQISHDVLFQMRRAGYQILQNPEDAPSDPEKPFITEKELIDDIVSFNYTNPISTAYRIMLTTKVNQNVLKRINQYKFSNSPGQGLPFSMPPPLNSIGPMQNQTGNRRTRRYSTIVQYNNNATLLSPMNTSQGGNSSRGSQGINPNSSLIANGNNADKQKARVIAGHSSTQSIAPKPTLNQPIASISCMNSAPDVNSSNGQGSFRNSKEIFPPTNKHEVKFAPPPIFAPAPNKSLPQKRHMSFSKSVAGASIVVPKVSFAQPNFV